MTRKEDLWLVGMYHCSGKEATQRKNAKCGRQLRGLMITLVLCAVDSPQVTPEGCLGEDNKARTEMS